MNVFYKRVRDQDAPGFRILFLPSAKGAYDLKQVYPCLTVGLVVACLFAMFRTMIRRPRTSRP